jgi:hypothetical protein
MAIIGSVAFGQSRTNEVLPRIDYANKELKSVIGWTKDSNGQWQSRPASILSYMDKSSVGLDNFKSLKLYTASYSGNEYIIIEKISNNHKRDYRYTSGYYIGEVVYYFIIKKQDFSISIKADSECKNHLPLSSGVKMEMLTELNKMPEILSPYIKTSENTLKILPLGSNIITVESIDIPTFFYKKDNVVRFFLNGGLPEITVQFFMTKDNNLSSLQEEYYYECTYEHFVEFFNPVIK